MLSGVFVEFDYYKNLIKETEHSKIYEAVLECPALGDRRTVAIKLWQHSVQDARCEAIKKSLGKEVQAIMKIPNRSRVELFNYTPDIQVDHFSFAMLVMHRYPDDLKTYFQGRVRPARHRSVILPEEDQLFMQQLCQMYQDCESVRCAHRDVKPENILVCDSWFAVGVPDLRLCDFECSKIFEDGSSSSKTVVGTEDHDPSTEVTQHRCWMAPEVAARRNNPQLPAHDSFQADIFSLGCLLSWVALNGKDVVFRTPAERDAEDKRASYARLDHYPFLQLLVYMMTHKDPSKRISLANAFHHPALFPLSTFRNFFHEVGNELKRPQKDSTRNLQKELKAVTFELRTNQRSQLHNPKNYYQLAIGLRDHLEHIKVNTFEAFLKQRQDEFLETFFHTHARQVVTLFVAVGKVGSWNWSSLRGYEFRFNE
jgi:serine/threonine protein kinase